MNEQDVTYGNRTIKEWIIYGAMQESKQIFKVSM